MMRKRGWGWRSGAIIMALTLAFAVAAPELAPPAGAATARAELAAKHKQQRHRKKLTAAQKKALLAKYIKSHPGVVAARRSGHGMTLAQRMRARHAAKAHAKKHKKAGPHKKTKKTKKKAHAKSKKNKKNKKNKKAASSSGMRRYAILFGGAALGLLALFLIYSSIRNRPRARAMARARKRPSPLATK
jgi:cobalamin biosynthesis Mg chelatase CobN